MKAIIIAAGQGSRLLPLTLDMPKCLVRVGGRAIIDHQLDAAEAAGITDAVVVGGYRIDQVGDHLARRAGKIATTLVFNPFWSISSSIGSVWAAHDHLRDAFMLMNGDTVFAASVIVDAVRAAPPGLTLVVEATTDIHQDDMRVAIAGRRVAAVGKGLDPAVADHRSLGIVLSTGGDAYARALRDTIAAPGGTDAYHHAVVARLAAHGVNALVVDPAADWQEVDAPADIARWEHGRHEDALHR
ncbi:phosphocholine cytidylyltransferase family protein [Sphingomonas sp. Tas61C01]|uniref:phosphocholine cytidylyltransferase family protein n=1 Tax=Sphingomonas sp. Tas61C01 TaxID=3458297 RepID=UPI00403ED139